MKRSTADEGVLHEEVGVCQGESGKAGVIIACVDVALVINVAVVNGRGYGGVYYLDGSSSLAGWSNCEGGAKEKKDM